jgi:hypothetical protein
MVVKLVEVMMIVVVVESMMVVGSVMAIYIGIE